MKDLPELHIHIYETARGLRSWIIDSETQLKHVKAMKGIQITEWSNDAFYVFLYHPRHIPASDLNTARRRALTKEAYSNGMSE